MARRGEAVHVATTTRKYNDKVYKSHLLRRTYREGGKVKHQTLGNISHLPEPVIEMIRQALRGETLVPADSVFQIERSLPHGHVAAVLGTLRRLGLDRTVASRRSRERDLVVAMIVARIIDPRSKLATARGLDEAASSLGDVMGLGSVDEDELYEAMDWLLARQAKIERALAKKHLANGSVVFCDVTSTYFEGRKCPLARLGHSRDGKRGLPQVNFGLLCDADGRPIAVEVFEGNTGDPNTLAAQVEKLQQRFSLDGVVLVGDRGLLTSARIREDLAPHESMRWITALRAPAIRQLVETGAFQLSLFDEQGLAEIATRDYPNERLIVCLNPLLAEDRARKREELLTATERDLEAIVAATRRERQPLRGKDRIGLRVGRVLGRHKVGKHFILDIGDERLVWKRDETRIAQEAALDGIYVLRTNVHPQDLSAEQTVQAYKNLSRVERGFRCFKGMDLRVRPVYHRLADRVRAHIFLCMLAYSVEWHLRDRLAPLLFDDHDRSGAAARRESVVAPAVRSASAERKSQTRSTMDGLPVHSFRDLLSNLATLCKNRVSPGSGVDVSFDQYTRPTPLQQRALELLDVQIRA